MLKTNNIDELRKQFSPAENAEIDRQVERMKRALTLRQLRDIVGVSQIQAAEAIGTTQGEISKIEARNDVKVSTLFDYVDALGGDLEIIAHIEGVPIPSSSPRC